MVYTNNHVVFLIWIFFLKENVRRNNKIIAIRRENKNVFFISFRDLFSHIFYFRTRLNFIKYSRNCLVRFIFVFFGGFYFSDVDMCGRFFRN